MTLPGIGVASGVGIFFGLYPACQVARHGPRPPARARPVTASQERARGNRATTG